MGAKAPPEAVLHTDTALELGELVLALDLGGMTHDPSPNLGPARHDS